MKLVKDCLPLLFDNVPSWKVKLLSLWPTIIGHISENVILDSIEGSTIVLAVKSSAWLHELNCLKMIIIEKINGALAGVYIDRIRFKNKEHNNKKNKLHGSHQLRKKTSVLKQLILSHSQQVALGNVVDAELKEVLKQFLLRCMNETIEIKK